MEEQKDQSNAEEVNYIKKGLKMANAVAGKGLVRKTGTGLVLWGIFTGDWVPVIGGLLVRLWMGIDSLQKKQESEEAGMLNEALPSAMVIAKAAHDKKLKAMASKTTDMDKAAAHVDKCTKPAPKSKQIIHIVKAARENIDANDPQPGDIAVVEMAEAMGI